MYNRSTRQRPKESEGAVNREQCPHVSKLLPSLWERMTESQREQILFCSSYYVFKKDEVIFQADRMPYHLYVLATGLVKICRRSFGERLQTLRIVTPIELFGYHSYFSGIKHTGMALAMERSTVCKIPMQVLEEIIATSPQVAMAFLADLSTKLCYTDMRLFTLTQKHLRGRLAETLLMLHGQHGETADDGALAITLSRQDMAELTNMTPGNVTRTVGAFVEEGLVELVGRGIRLREIEKLQDISHMG